MRVRGRRALRQLLVTAAVAVGLAGCMTVGGSGPGPQGGAGGRVDAPGPPEITAGPADRLPAGTPGRGTPAIAIGTKDFTEQFLLGELYTQALRAKGYTVQLEQNVGPSETMDTAFASNQIQMYPEYLGVIATGMAADPGANTPLGVYQSAKRFEETERDATVLKQTPYQNLDVLIVKRELAERHGLRAISDLAALGSDVRLAAQPAFGTRPAGLPGLRDVYGLTDMRLLAMTPGTVYEALQSGQADVADAFSTDAQLRSGDYVALDDPANLFGFQYMAPVVKRANLQRMGPEFAQTCNWVSSLLTADAMRTMSEQVQIDGQSEAAVARAFLASRGLR